jgi:hypothetical protein
MLNFRIKKALQTMRVIIMVLAIFVSTQAEAWEWAVNDIYGDAPHLLIQPMKPIDLRFEKESSLSNHKEREKTLSSDFDEFIKENLFTYTMLWAGRSLYDSENVKALFTTPLSKYLHNITGWQACNMAKADKGLCSPRRRSFRNPPLLDGDAFITNFIQHPIFGTSTYLYYRARGYDRPASALASFLTSALYEYTVEGLKQSPSLNDLIVTPGLGVPLGMILEETSNQLSKSNSQALRLISYLVNPTRAIIPDGRIAWHNLLGRTVSFQFSW